MCMMFHSISETIFLCFRETRQKGAAVETAASASVSLPKEGG